MGHGTGTLVRRDPGLVLTAEPRGRGREGMRIS